MTAIRIVPATAGADEHPSQADEALRRAREADRRGGQQGRPTSLTTTVDDEFAAIVRTLRSGHGSQQDRCPICEYWECRCPR
jgi:hypothetical protein